MTGPGAAPLNPMLVAYSTVTPPDVSACVEFVVAASAQPQPKRKWRRDNMAIDYGNRYPNPSWTEAP